MCVCNESTNAGEFQPGIVTQATRFVSYKSGYFGVGKEDSLAAKTWIFYHSATLMS